jgi:hypothetical protein
MTEKRFLLEVGDQLYYTGRYDADTLDGTVRRNSNTKIWIHWDKGHREREWPLDEYEYPHYKNDLFWEQVVFCCSKGST